MYRMTTFSALETKGKIPLSPYGDNTFDFISYRTSDPKELYRLLVNNFVLNIPLSISNIRSRRRVLELGEYICSELNYLVLDLDNITTKKAQNKVLEYFKQYKCIIGESKSNNNIDNFRLKGILFIEEMDLKTARQAIQYIHDDLKEYCDVDTASARRVSLNAPIQKLNILLESDKDLYKFEFRNPVERDYSEFSDVSGLETSGQSATVIELCLEVFKNMGFEEMQDQNSTESIQFQHNSEVKSPGGYFWFYSSPFIMHHYNASKSINIFDTVRKLPEYKEINSSLDYSSLLTGSSSNYKKIYVDQQFMSVTSEFESCINEFLEESNPKKFPFIKIKSPMGTGKSTVIGHIITEAIQKDLRVLVITNRISVAVDFGTKYNLKLYNKDMYNVGDSIIVQYDSLHRYNIVNFDVVIMDEFVSLLIHSRSNLSNNPINSAKFFAAFSKKLVIADAFLTGYEDFLLNRPVIELINNYRDSTKLLDYTDVNNFVLNIIKSSEKIKDSGKQVTVSSTSLAFINEVELLLKTRGLRTIVLTAETSSTTKDILYDLFKTEHNKFDVLLYSPTLTVGVSNMNLVNDHFHYDSSMSSDVISSLQMIKRSRKARTIHLHIKSRVKFSRTNFNSVRDEYLRFAGNSDSYLFETDDYGEPRLSRNGAKSIKIDVLSNILSYNHREAFFYLSKFHFENTPEVVDKRFDPGILTPYKNEIKKLNSSNIKNRISEMLLLTNLEKYDISVGKVASDRILRMLIDLEEYIINEEHKEKILEIALKDPSFIQKCRNYKILVNLSNGELSSDDINAFIHRSIVQNSDDLLFYRTLLNLDKFELKNTYLPKEVNTNRNLKYVLTESGYSNDKQSNTSKIGFRGFSVNKNVKKYYKELLI